MARNNNPTKEIHKTKKSSKLPTQNKQTTKQQHLPSSWLVMKNILTCKHLEVSQQPQQTRNSKQKQNTTMQVEKPIEPSKQKSKKMRCSGSLCNNTKVMHRPEPNSPESLQRKTRNNNAPIISQEGSNNRSYNITNTSSRSNSNAGLNKSLSSSNSNVNANFAIKGTPFRRFSGCYECRMVIDPLLAFTRDPSLRATICSCPDCGAIFMKPELLELHQAVRHAVSELGQEDTSKNIVEIIFQSSWLMKQIPICKIDRILKVHNTQRTINRFEEYRDLIKFKATNLPKKQPRCIADGNELLRFYCTTFKCSLGLNGSSNLCNSIPHCNICSIIKNGFKLSGDVSTDKILTTATSGRAHERARVGPDEHERRAMLVCRVIAGRVKMTTEGGGVVGPEECDSVAGPTGVYSNLDELYVFNPKAILPCFVVIYGEF